MDVDFHHVDSSPLASPLFSRQQPVEDSDSDGGGDENTGLADSDEFQELVRFPGYRTAAARAVGCRQHAKVAHAMRRMELGV